MSKHFKIALALLLIFAVIMFGLSFYANKDVKNYDDTCEIAPDGMEVCE